MNLLKSSIGLIVLSGSIITAALILTQRKVTHPDTSYYTSDMNVHRITGDTPANRIPIGISTNGNDVTYNSELKIGKDEKLVIQLANGTKEIIEGKNILAKYFHVAKLLTVRYEVGELNMLRYYNSPIAWGNKE